MTNAHHKLQFLHRFLKTLSLCFFGMTVICHTLVQADQVELLVSDQDSLQRRIDLIKSAEKEILISYYIFEDDVTAMGVLNLLRDATQRGVSVKILLDGFSGKIPDEMIRYLTQTYGIEFKKYNKLNILHPKTLNKRLHDKLFIVDENYAIIGGRNIDNSYYGFGDRYNFQDMDFLASGKVIAEVKSYFMQRFQSEDVLTASSDSKKNIVREEIEQTLKNGLAELLSHLPAKTSDDDKPLSWKENLKEVGEVQFFHDPVEFNKSKKKYKKQAHNDWVVDSYSALFDKATSEIIIENAYFILTDKMFDCLKRAVSRGVHVRVLTNSILSSDIVMSAAATAKDLKDLVRAGIEVWLFGNDDVVLHTKMAIIDQKTVVGGSFNLDPRSEYLNTETVISFEDSAYSKELLKHMDHNIEGSFKIDRNGRVVDNGKAVPPGSKWIEKVKFNADKLIIPFIRQKL